LFIFFFCFICLFVCFFVRLVCLSEGGNSYLRSGPGCRIERIYREVRVIAIGGGSEEIMMDLAVRLAKL
jgi:alkylation response protein AidB-like acyl-CoA dehydrogenase